MSEMEELLRGVARKLAENYPTRGLVFDGTLRESGLLRLLEAGQAMRE